MRSPSPTVTRRWARTAKASTRSTCRTGSCPPTGRSGPVATPCRATATGGDYHVRSEIFDTARDNGITGFAILAGDLHSFWAAYAPKSLPLRYRVRHEVPLWHAGERPQMNQNGT